MDRQIDDLLGLAHPMHRALVDSQPGYPTATIGGGGRGGDVSDPTSRYALEHDTSAADLARWYQALDYAAKWLTEAWYLTTQHMDALSTKRRCANPNGCPGYRLAAHDRGGLCQPCYRRALLDRQQREAAA